MAQPPSPAPNGARVASPTSHRPRLAMSRKLRNSPLRLPALVVLGGATTVAIGVWPVLALGSLVSPVQSLGVRSECSLRAALDVEMLAVISQVLKD